jgi:hypothetical protein
VTKGDIKRHRGVGASCRLHQTEGLPIMRASRTKADRYQEIAQPFRGAQRHTGSTCKSYREVNEKVSAAPLELGIEDAVVTRPSRSVEMEHSTCVGNLG